MRSQQIKEKKKGQKRQTATCLPMHQVVKVSIASRPLRSRVGEVWIRVQHCRAYRSCWYPAAFDHLAAVSSLCCSANRG
jgi:hypothetical protein